MTRGEAKSLAACFGTGAAVFLIGASLWPYAGPKLFFAAVAAALTVGTVIAIRSRGWREAGWDAADEVFAALLGAGICYLLKVTVGLSLW